MKYNSKSIALAIALLSIPLVPHRAYAQFDSGPTIPAPAWKSFHLNPKTKLKLNFKNASVDAVLEFLSKASGITIVKDPSIKTPITVVSADSVTLDSAFNIVNTILGLQGDEMTKSGNLIVVRAKRQQRPSSENQNAASFFHQEKTVLQVYPIQYADATSVANLINQVFSQTPGDQGNRFNFFRGGRGNFNQNQNQTQQGPQVKASSDDYSNSVIVNATPEMQTQVKDIIAQIDKQTNQPTTTVVYKLQYADANNLASVIQNVLTTNAPTGRGGANNQNSSFQGRFQQMLRFGSSQAGFGEVAVDADSNALVVSATEENQKLVAQVISQLDKPIKIEDSTFVFPLDNAKAEDVANLLQEAFGNRQGVSGAGYKPNTNTSQTIQNQRQGIPTTNGSSRLGGLDLGGSTQDPVAESQMDNIKNQLALALQDPNATAGELQTLVSVVQGRGFQRIMQQNRSQSNSGLSSTQGRSINGQVIDIRDLSGQATFIPDLNTNSLIVVAPPEYVPVIRQILDQLDKLPEQVVIETVILEANLTASDQFGLEYKFNQQKAFGSSTENGSAAQGFGLQNASPALQGFSYTLTGGALSAFFNMLKSQGNFNVLSTPTIFTSNNVQAQINVSQSVPYIINSIVNDTGSTSYTYGFENVGIVLTVTPRITSNGYVTMEIDQTANDLQGYTSFNAPIVNQREATTTVSAKDGNTVVLGGIISDQVSTTTNKIPLLGDIPILGNLFKSTNSSKQKTELILFLTPHIINNDDDAKKLKTNTIKDLSPDIQKRVKDLFNSATFKQSEDTNSNSTTKGKGK